LRKKKLRIRCDLLTPYSHIQTSSISYIIQKSCLLPNGISTPKLEGIRKCVLFIPFIGNRHHLIPWCCTEPLSNKRTKKIGKHYCKTRRHWWWCNVVRGKDSSWIAVHLSKCIKSKLPNKLKQVDSMKHLTSFVFTLF